MSKMGTNYALDMASATNLMDVEGDIVSEELTLLNEEKRFDGFKTINSLIRGTRTLERSMMMGLSVASTLGILTEGNKGANEILRDAVALGMIAMGGLKAYQVLTNSKKVIEETRAAIEATAHAIAQDWTGIAMAGAAATMTYATFDVSQKFSSGEWSFSGDINTPHGQRSIENSIRSVA